MKNNQFPEKIDVRILAENDSMWHQIHSSDMYSIYHKKFWKNLIEETFKHTGVYLTALKNGNLIDVLPFFLVKKCFLGKKLISTPYEGCNGGFSSSDVKVRKMLTEKILEYASELNVKYIEIRSRSPINELKDSGFVETKPFIISKVPLISMDENWKMLSSTHRKHVKRAQKMGVSVVTASTWYQMESFYRILVDHYHDLGVPFFGKKFFRQIWDKLIRNNYGCLLIAKYQREIIGGNLLFFSGKTLIAKYAAYRKNKEFSKLYASDALYWEPIRLGIHKDFTNLDLGVTGESNPGLLDFKSKFGSENRPVYFYYYPIRGKIPDFAKYYGEYSLLKKIWRASPTILTSGIGQKINEWIC